MIRTVQSELLRIEDFVCNNSLQLQHPPFQPVMASHSTQRRRSAACSSVNPRMTWVLGTIGTIPKRVPSLFGRTLSWFIVWGWVRIGQNLWNYQSTKPFPIWPDIWTAGTTHPHMGLPTGFTASQPFPHFHWHVRRLWWFLVHRCLLLLFQRQALSFHLTLMGTHPPLQALCETTLYRDKSELWSFFLGGGHLWGCHSILLHPHKRALRCIYIYRYRYR